jgi:hypothetical protein
MFVSGQRYQMEAVGRWRDLTIKRDANGFTSSEVPILGGVMEKHEPKRRMPHENWFKLIGAVDRDQATAFAIGTSHERVAQRSGQLTCYANDEPGFYWNNFGSVELTVTRIE